jgi:hypothetical protein
MLQQNRHSWESKVLFPTYHTEAFEATIFHLKNLTAISIDNINMTVIEAMTKSQSDNKAVKDYFKDLENIKLCDPRHITPTTNVFHCTDTNHNSILVLHV